MESQGAPEHWHVFRVTQNATPNTKYWQKSWNWRVMRKESHEQKRRKGWTSKPGRRQVAGGR